MDREGFEGEVELVWCSVARGVAFYIGAASCPPLLPRRGGGTAAWLAASVHREVGSAGRLGGQLGSSLAGGERCGGWQGGPAAALYKRRVG